MYAYSLKSLWPLKIEGSDDVQELEVIEQQSKEDGEIVFLFEISLYVRSHKKQDDYNEQDEKPTKLKDAFEST